MTIFTTYTDIGGSSIRIGGERGIPYIELGIPYFHPFAEYLT